MTSGSNTWYLLAVLVEDIKGECIYQESQEKRDGYEMMVLGRSADFRPVLETFLREGRHILAKTGHVDRAR